MFPHPYLHLLLFLSLTAKSPALAKYAKPGCSDKCGNVTIPFPFGIAAECWVNQWYIVDCNNSTPYLSALNHLEVMAISVENQTITVSMPRISDCPNPVRNSNQITSVDLSRSPFLYSKSHNKFVFEGCGIASMMYNGNVVTGCSTACLNVTLSDRNSCFGNGCCQTAIPHYLKWYSINLTGIERQGEDGGCGSAFLVDETSYDQARLSDPFIFKNASFIPVSLLWTLTDLDQVTCCDKMHPSRPKVDMFNGTLMDTLKCNYIQSSEYNPYLIDGCTQNEIAKYAKTGCSDKCGNVTIPFPFGIGTDCYINQWYQVDCNSSKPYLPALNHLEILGVNLENLTVTVSTVKDVTQTSHACGT